jgi:hypothetical protein
MMLTLARPATLYLSLKTLSRLLAPNFESTVFSPLILISAHDLA